MKEQKQETGFRRVPGGYRKADVNSYILAMDRRAESDGEAYKMELDALRNRIAALEAERRDLADKLTAAETECTSLRETLTDRERALTAVSEELAEVRSRLAAPSSAAEEFPTPESAVKTDAPAPEAEKPSATAAVKQPSDAVPRRRFVWTLDFPLRRKSGRS